YLGGLTINKSGAVVSAGDTIVYAFNYSASGNSYEFWDSKSDSSTTGTVTAGDFSLSTVVTLGSTDNSNRYMRGMVGEVKIYNAALSSGEFETQRDALVTKWVVIVDNDPPTPNPATWESAPSAVNAFAVSMTATTGSDINGVEYMFTETTGNPGATSSQWQKTPVYRDDFLEPLTEYRYTVTMRDYAEPANVGTASSEVIVTTPDVVPGRTDGPPNVVVLYADDLGYSDISYNAPAGSFSNTPTLDSICTNGVYFSNYVTHHVCSPSRAGLLTGRHYTRVGAGPEVGGTLDNSIPNMAKDFQAAGYETAAYGKWHNSSVPDDKGNAIYVSSRDLVIRDNDTYEQYRDIAWGEGVNAYGFDDWAGFYGGGSDYFDRFGSWSNEIDWWINGVFSPHTPGYTQDLIAANAANFITENAHQPFFVHVAMEAVHTPYHIKRSDLETMCGIVDDIDPSLAWNNVKLLASPTTSNLIQDVEELRCTPGDEFDKDVLNGTLSGFADLVYSTLAYALDNTAGQILDRLDEHGLTNNTIIVFASDNGGTTSGNNWPFTGSKHTLWEGGIHVPAAIWWPGTLDASTAPYSPGNNSYSHMTQYFDWYPTLMSMTGSTLNGTDLDGLNLHANLLSRTATRSGFENCYFGLDSDWGTVRTERWKLHFNRIPGNQKIELYDLENDIDESNNVQASNPVERDTLIALFDQWFDSGAVSSNYMPLHEDNISYPLPAPDSDILEVQATQT
ncbi:MAG: sulfatase-like hydrolase/transferase, partial [Planctomycetes bacterium]|nr:sulfatase-like hydrolase/transferase [Planctomycetota bacterium]